MPDMRPLPHLACSPWCAKPSTAALRDASLERRESWNSIIALARVVRCSVECGVNFTELLDECSREIRDGRSHHSRYSGVAWLGGSHPEQDVLPHYFGAPIPPGTRPPAANARRRQRR